MLPVRASLFPCALTLLLVAGCSRPIAPQASDAVARGAVSEAAAARLFYPLDLGNHWRFHRVFTLGAPGSPTPTVRRSRIEHDLVCVETLEGREYVIDRVTQVDSTLAGAVTFHQWIRDRQDPTGLYEADVDIGTTPACAGGGASSGADEMEALEDWRASSPLAIADPVAAQHAMAALAGRLRLARRALAGGTSGVENGELTRLRYPLRVGDSWTIREEPRFTSSVEAFETLRLPMGNIQAYRVRVNAAGFGPEDRVLSWYSRSGLVGILVHVEIPTDLGPLIAEDVIDLEALSIDRGRF